MEKKKTELRSMNVKMRLSPFEHEFLKEKAEELCLTVSDYLRCLIMRGEIR